MFASTAWISCNLTVFPASRKTTSTSERRTASSPSSALHISLRTALIRSNRPNRFVINLTSPMTKVQAIVKVMQVNGGSATLPTIYSQAGKYYKGLKTSTNWKAGLRGVLYREVYNGKTFKKI